ncbi:hypothetical protein QBC35DRAFT_374740 [Podospora australis]|uniref:F-box domain-containing protein n=1 Tax=Podospora australis TaxID=1536484 RepID=A0AAN6X0X6_9PEZI|nr:hypothetical protein QBC35DRAFT_374740 [Podospora australis]
MMEVTGYPQPHHFGHLADRVHAPAPITPSPTLSNMSFILSNYYSPSLPASQPSEARSPSALSATSSTSHVVHPGTISRTLSPASGIADSAVSGVMVAGSHHQYPEQQQSYSSHAHSSSLLPSPSQYFQTHIPPPVPLYSSLSNHRHYTQPSSYGLQLTPLAPQPPTMPLHSYHTIAYLPYDVHYQNTAAAALQAQYTPQLSYRTPFMAPRKEPPKESVFLRGLQRLPQEVISKIHKYLTYLECHNIARTHPWIRANFNPHTLPVEDKIAGVRYAEQYYRRYFPGRITSGTGSNNSGAREYDAMHPGSFGCYHCFRMKGPENFEKFDWNNKDIEASVETPSPPASPSTARSSPTGNPHYDPTVTRSSVVAAQQAAANQSRRGGPGTAGGGRASALPAGLSAPNDDSPRIRETWGIRRFCIDCGIQKRYYKPGDLIPLCKAKTADNKTKDAVWVCQCRKIHFRPAEIKCLDCGSFIPLSTPSRRRNN